MLNDFYCDIDNIMEKQASPYKTHSYNNIKVFFSVILSFSVSCLFFLFVVVVCSSRRCGRFACAAQPNLTTISICIIAPFLYNPPSVRQYIKVMLRRASSRKHSHAHSPNSNVICLLFCNSTH